VNYHGQIVELYCALNITMLTCLP